MRSSRVSACKRRHKAFVPVASSPSSVSVSTKLRPQLSHRIPVPRLTTHPLRTGKSTTLRRESSFILLRARGPCKMVAMCSAFEDRRSRKSSWKSHLRPSVNCVIGRHASRPLLLGGPALCPAFHGPSSQPRIRLPTSPSSSLLDPPRVLQTPMQPCPGRREIKIEVNESSSRLTTLVENHD